MSAGEFKALEDTVRGFLRANNLQDSRILVAFSGGSDSLGLLALLSQMTYVHAVYVDHGIRPVDELDSEMEANRRNCEALGVSYDQVHLGRGKAEALAQQRGKGLEEACRTLRYEALELKRLELGMDYIATAHTADDVSETMLMRILRGSPLYSIRGPRPINGLLVRPLLGVTKDQLRAYLVHKGLSWSEDSTNVEPFCLRNKVRLGIIPAIEKAFPSYREALCRLDVSIALLKGLELDYSRPIPLEKLQKADENGRLQAIYALWDRQCSSGKELSLSFCSQVLRLIEKGSGRAQAAGWQFSINKGCLALFPIASQDFEYPVQGERGLLDLGGGRAFAWGPDIDSDSKTLFWDRTFLSENASLQNARPGMTIKLSGGTKTVFSLLGDQKVPLALKAQVPVLLDKGEVKAVFARSFGGADRLCVDFKLALAPSKITLYSIVYT